MDRGLRHRLAVGGMAGLAATVYATYALVRFASFGSSTYDLVIFDQAVRSYSRFELPVAIVKGVHNGFGPDFPVLGDHWSPILALLAPLYWIHDGPQTLLVAQALLLAAAIGPLWLFARRELGARAAYCVAVAYALSWPVAEATGFDFHEVAFAPLLTALMFERLSALGQGSARWWHVVLPAAGLLCVKEDMGLLVAGFGMSLLAYGKWRRTRTGLWLGIGFTVGGLLSAWVTTRVLVPLFGGRADYYWAYDNFGPTPASAAAHAVTNPLDVLATLVTPDVKVQTLLWLVAIAALTPLLSPYTITVLPLLALRLLAADFPAWWGTSFHYNAFIVVPLLCAGVDGAVRLRQIWSRQAVRVSRVWGAAVVAVAVASVPVFTFGSVTGGLAGERRDTAAAAAVERVPDGALVEAVNNLGPQLSERATVLLWDRTPRWAPWVVADVREHRFQFCDVREQRERVALLRRSGYQTVFQRAGYLVLHRPGPEPALPPIPSPHC